MDKQVVKFTPNGCLRVPSSKSYSHRYLISAFIYNKPVTITNVNLCDDVTTTIDCLEALGGVFAREKDTIKFVKRENKTGQIILNVKESGTSLRMLFPLAIYLYKNVKFIGAKSLFNRPMGVYKDILEDQKIPYEKGEDFIEVKGQLKPTDFEVKGDISSQFISGLLLSLPLLRVDSMIRVIPPFSSSSYVDITIECLKKAGIKIERRGEYEFNIPANQSYKSFEVTVEGDYSGASNILALGALCGEVTLTNLFNHSIQGDKKIIEVLETMGSKVKITKDSVSTTKSQLGTIEIDVDNIIDLAPLIIVLACLSDGISYIYNVHRLRFKEQNRLDTIIEEMEKIGFYIENNNESLKVYGGINMDGPAIVSAHNDHRTFMALAVAACMIKNGLIIDGVECVNKSYPKFLDDLEKIGVNVNRSI